MPITKRRPSPANKEQHRLAESSIRLHAATAANDLVRAFLSLLFLFTVVNAPFPRSASAVGGDFANTDFAAAAPFTYDHSTGGGAYNDRTVGDFNDVTEQLEGGQFSCGDIVTYLAQIQIEAVTVETVQTAQFDFKFLANSTGQAGAAHTEVVGVSINYGQVENGDGGGETNPGAGSFGLDSGISDDGGSTATLISSELSGPLFQSGSELLATVEIDDLEAGEKVVLRIDTRLACDPGSSPTGNLQGQLDAGMTLPSSETINTGQQTIPFLRIGDIAGAGEPLLQIQKTVMSAGGTCGVDDVEELSAVTAGDTVTYCYTVSNPGTADLFDVVLEDDNGTPGNTNDDFEVSCSLPDLDGEGDAGDLAGGATVDCEASVILNSAGTVTNIASISGNNGRSGGNFKELNAEDSATVNVQSLPNRPPVALEDNTATEQDINVSINAAGNDSDPDGNLDAGSANTDCATCSLPSNGTLVNNGDGTFTYAPDQGYVGPDSFVYEICDTDGLCDTATVNIEVTPVEQPLNPPVADNDSGTTPEEEAVIINAAANDSDVDGNLDPTTATVTTEPQHGTVVNHGDGTFTYTPDPDYNGSDSFVYEICDTDGLCDTATVTLDVTPVNDEPVAEDDSRTTPEDQPVTIDAAANDSDVDGNLDPATATVTSGPSHGTVTSNGDGTFTYTPDLNFNGEDSFDYQICDEGGLCDTATVVLDVTPVNDPPVARDDSEVTDEDTSVMILVTTNDSDVDGNLDPTTATAISDPQNGTVLKTGAGTFTYTPDPDYNGSDSFVYEICDTDGLCAVATVNILISSVDDYPVANVDSDTTPEDQPVTIDAAANDSDVDDNLDPATATVTSGPSHGTVTSNGDGTFTYTPDLNFNGEDSFDYQICDTTGLCATATVTVTVTPVNDPPVAVDDSYQGLQDTTLTYSVENGVLKNDSDVDGDYLKVTSYDSVSAFGGTLSVNYDGSVDYTPTPGFAGYDTFTYQACDYDGLCDTATVLIQVDARNNRSISLDLEDWTMNSDGSLSGSLLITNQSGEYDVQITDMEIVAQYRESGPGKKLWIDVAITENTCNFDPAPDFLVTDQAWVNFSGCELSEAIPAGATLRVTAHVQVFGRIKGSKTDGWFLSRAAKKM